MKASTLFGLTIAIFLGLGIVVGARYMGFFDPTPPPEKKAATNHPQVLIAARNLFQGTAVGGSDVKVRRLTEEEVDFYEKNRERLMPAIESAVEARVLAKNVPAGQILFEEQFEKQALPESISERLEPGMRSVHIELPRERAAGGLIRVGERVDVLLTSTVFPDTAAADAFTATAAIARNLKVIVKRDNLWTVMQGVPPDKPVTYLLQGNPYRAALLEYAKHKGLLTLVPTATSLTGKGGKEAVNDPDSKEYRDEDRRINEFLNNEHVVGDADLERIFNLNPRLLPMPTPPPPASKVEMMIGTKVAATFLVENGAVISRNGGANLQSKAGAGSAAANEPPSITSYRFVHPDGAPPPISSKPGTPGCKSCQKKQ